jgi:hypothetical protein
MQETNCRTSSSPPPQIRAMFDQFSMEDLKKYVEEREAALKGFLSD